MSGTVPRPASTVVLLRDQGADPQVWLMRRRTTLPFAGGMHAFPGGAVEPTDADLGLPWTGTSPAQLAVPLGVDAPTAQALASAAVRETFEECGVLLVAGPTLADPVAEQARVALLDGSLDWSSFLAGHGLAVDGSALVPWSRWVTPDWSPRRYDAYFFVARLPAGREPRWIDDEADQASWCSVRGAVTAHERGELPMLPPTIETLRAVAAHRDVASVLDARPARILEDAG